MTVTLHGVAFDLGKTDGGVRGGQSCRYDGDYKKRESGFYWDYRKYVGIPEGLRKMKQKAVGIL